MWPPPLSFLVCPEVPSLQDYGVNVEKRQKLVGNQWISCLMCYVSHRRNTSVFSTRSLCSPVRPWLFTISYHPFKIRTGACCSASIARALPWIGVHFWWPWLASSLVRVAASRTGHRKASIPQATHVTHDNFCLLQICSRISLCTSAAPRTASDKNSGWEWAAGFLFDRVSFLSFRWCSWGAQLEASASGTAGCPLPCGHLSESEK